MKIKTPKGGQHRTRAGGVALLWNAGLPGAWSARFEAAQRLVDAEALRCAAAYVPVRTGALAAGAVAENGTLRYTVPYAAAVYYGPQSGGAGPGRGPYWFERMKAACAGEILQKAANLTGGRA